MMEISLPASLDRLTLARAYESQSLSPTVLITNLLRRINSLEDPHIWLSRFSDEQILARAAQLEKIGRNATMRLWGIPFAVKDNIDVQGLATTAGCSAFSLQPEQSAPIVERLLAEGAILIGKNTLDQFATGLSGTRGAGGNPLNPFHSDYTVGGSSSGSAVAVSRGLVSFALATDTAGSGRVPAAYNHIIGLKPTPGLVSTRGIVPASRSLDCVAILGVTVADTILVRDIISGYDSADPWSRHSPSSFNTAANAATSDTAADEMGAFRFGIPASAQLPWFGKIDYAPRFNQAVARLKSLGGIAIEVDFQPFAAASDSFTQTALYAERAACIGDFVTAHPEAVLPELREIVARASSYSAVDLCRAHYRLMALRRQSEVIWQKIDLLLLPTVGGHYRLDEVAADPLRIPTSLGRYTAFANLFGNAVIALPSGLDESGLPFGVSLVVPSYRDRWLDRIAARFEAESNQPLGASGVKFSEAMEANGISNKNKERDASGNITIAVIQCQANVVKKLSTLGGQRVESVKTAAQYRLFAIAVTKSPSERMAGLMAIANGDQGFAIELELWQMPKTQLATWLEGLDDPFALSMIELADGRRVLCQVIQPQSTAGAVDISGYESWNAYYKFLNGA